MRAHVVASIAFIVATLASFVSTGACGDNLEVDPSGDNDAATSPEAAAPRCADKTLFVSASTGNDGNDGCSSDKPLRTISAAIGRAKTNGATDHQAKVCAGVYPEAIILDHPLSIRGGYDCFNWKRAEPFGFPNLPSNPETKIEVTTGEAAFLIKSETVTRATEIEGLTIVGPTFGLFITAGAAPTIQHCVVRGNLIGVSIEEASPSLLNSNLAAGTVPLDIKKSTLTAAKANPLRELRVSMIQEKGGQSWAGIRLQEGADVEITDSQIRGGAVTCASGGVCFSVGVQALPTSKVTIERARIAGGEVLNPNPQSRTAAVYATQANVTLINNMLHSGSTSYTPQPETQAVVLDRCPSPRVFNNTLFATGSSNRTGAIYLFGNTTDAIVQNNILGSTLGHGFAVVLDRCAGSVTRIENNAGVNVRGAGLSVCSTGGAGGADTERPLITAHFESDQPAARLNNVSLVNACGTALAALDQSRCTKCASTDTCVTELIAGWNASRPDSGLTALFSPDGWKLLPTAACRIAKPSTPLVTSDKDAFGTTRTDPQSMGAHEQDMCSSP